MADVDTVRALAGVTPTDWADETVQGLLDAEAGAVKLAAADLLEAVAAGLLTVDSDQIKVDGSKQAAVLMQRAANLRQQFYERDGGGFFFDSTPLGPGECYRLGPGYTDFQFGWEGPVL